VWRGVSQAGDDVAVKLFKPSRIVVGLTLPAFRRGVAVMNRLTARGADAEGVVALEAVSLNRLGVMMRYAANGSALDLPALGWQVKSIVEFMQQLCRIVERAHAAGALHRCLKPQNVLLDADLRPLLADFDMVDLPTLAAESRDVGGYAAYAAPEELLGQGTQSPTADVYSLGRILHYLLLGSEPEPAAGETATLDDLRQRPAGLVRIVRKCTARAPHARYQQVEELRADLARYDDGDAVGLAGTPDPGAVHAPQRVSSLSHRTPWLGRRAARASEHAAPQRPSAVAKPRDKRRPEAPPPPEPLGLSRKAEQLVGVAGLLGLAGAVFAVIFAGANPTPALLTQTHVASVVAGAAASLLMPRADSRGLFWRIVWMLIAAAVLYVANLPSLAAPPIGPPARVGVLG
jgi:serine/threonine protein kinase